MISPFDYLDVVDREELQFAAEAYDDEEEFIEDWKQDRDLRQRFGAATEEILRGAFARAHEEKEETK